MKVDCDALSHIHLDPGYALLSMQNTLTSIEMFNILDIHGAERLNDVQFQIFMKNITNLSNYQVQTIFNLFDIDHSGELEFDEYYLIFCILIANKDAYEKEFIYRHSKTIFQLIDTDGSGEVSVEEFKRMGILFNFDASAIRRIFVEFDVSGDKSLDFAEFRLFTMACIDEARAQAARRKVKAYDNYHNRLLAALEPTLRRFIRTDCLPLPRVIETTTNKVRLPFTRGGRNWKKPFTSHLMSEKFTERREILRNYIQNLFGGRVCLFKCCRIVCCDFCCLDHGDDTCKCDIKLRCECKCFSCICYSFRRCFGCCRCCCHCCPCQTRKSRLHQGETSAMAPSWGGDHLRRPSIRISEKQDDVENKIKRRVSTRWKQKLNKKKELAVQKKNSCGIM